MSEDNCKRIQETFKFWDLVRLILEVLRYIACKTAVTEAEQVKILNSQKLALIGEL